MSDWLSIGTGSSSSSTTNGNSSNTNTKDPTTESPKAISSPSSPKLDEHKIPEPDFTGKWKLKDYKGIDDYLKSEGWNWMMRKAISKLGNHQYIYHHHRMRMTSTSTSTSPSPSSHDTTSTSTSNNDSKQHDDQQQQYEEEENISIKSVNKGGVYELISSANLYDKKEIIYKDTKGNKVISVFKWNREKTQIIEFLLKEIKGSDDAHSSTSSSSSYYRRSKGGKKAKKKQKSYTRCRYIDGLGQMIVTETNQIGKQYVSIYVKEDDISIQQLKHILKLPLDADEQDEVDDEHKQQHVHTKQRAHDALSGQFPVDIVEIERTVKQTESDEERLSVENIAIQKEIQSLSEQIRELEGKLLLKTDELEANIAKNDENVRLRNLVTKWKEFEAEWTNWDALYFMAWLQRLQWRNQQYSDYEITKAKVDGYCVRQLNVEQFVGKFLQKFDRDAVRQIGVEDEQDSLCVYQHILKLMERNPVKAYSSPLKYEKKTNEKQVDELVVYERKEQEEEAVAVVVANGEDMEHLDEEHDDLKQLLNDVKLGEYYGKFEEQGLCDLNAIIVQIKEKGMDDFEQRVLSEKLSINKIAHRMKIVNGIKAYLDNDDDFEHDEHDDNDDVTGVHTADLL